MTIHDDFESEGGCDAIERNNNVRHRKTGSGDGAWSRVDVTYAPRLPPGAEGKKLIGINGNWYDITNFIQHHPGGSIIENFVGKDATEPFRGFHEKDVLKHRKPFATYPMPTSDEAGQKFAQLHDYFIEQGYFKTSYRWYAIKIVVALVGLAACIGILCLGSSLTHLLAAAFCLFFFWQQCGFFMHDFGHSQWFHEPKWDNVAGTVSGTVCVGINGSWWRNEHFVHHAMLNVVNYATGFFDPQMKEDIWAQSEKLFPFYKTRIQWLLIKVGHRIPRALYHTLIYNVGLEL